MFLHSGGVSAQTRERSHTRLTVRHVNTRCHVPVVHPAEPQKPPCKSEATHVHTFSHSFDMFLHVLLWYAFSAMAPWHNKGSGSPCSIFHASTSTTLSSLRLSQGFITSRPTCIQQIWTDLIETESRAEVRAHLQIYMHPGQRQIRTCLMYMLAYVKAQVFFCFFSC